MSRKTQLEGLICAGEGLSHIDNPYVELYLRPYNSPLAKAVYAFRSYNWLVGFGYYE